MSISHGNELTRRQILTAAGASAGVIASGAVAAGQTRSANSRERKKALRVAHITDIHVQPELKAGEGMAACLEHVHSLAAKPDLILCGGDAIMDCMSADEARTRQQWDLWQRVLNANCHLPFEPCIGNHDVWGWNQLKSRTTGREPLYGKRYAMDVFGMSERFRSFDRAGWHFVVLDSTFPYGQNYIARLDEAQFEWLAADLAATPRNTPILILSHIPLLAACTFFDGDNEKSGNWLVPGRWMHIDARRIKTLFQSHPHVKLCLSGHIHLVDRVDYLGVTYLCNGAVCAGWWEGPYQECRTGYGVIDLYDDGSFEHDYVVYPWKSPEE